MSALLIVGTLPVPIGHEELLRVARPTHMPKGAGQQERATRAHQSRLRALAPAMSRQSHATVTIELDGRSVDIDAEMAEIIERLWSLGIVTRNCCQGSAEFDPVSASFRDFAYIMFDEIDGLRAFLELFEGTELASRRTGQRWDFAEDGVTLVPRLPRSWMFGAGVHPARHDSEAFVISGTVRFAPSDIELIRQCLSSMACWG